MSVTEQPFQLRRNLRTMIVEAESALFQLPKYEDHKDASNPRYHCSMLVKLPFAERDDAHTPHHCK